MPISTARNFSKNRKLLAKSATVYAEMKNRVYFDKICDLDLVFKVLSP